MGTGDFNGDGKSDIVWQNDNGTPSMWLMNGTTVLSRAVLPTSGPTWHVSNGDRMHFINGTLSAGTLLATSQADEFVLTSHATGMETITGFDPRQDILELSKAHFTGFADVQAHTVASAGGFLLALDNSSSLLLSGVAPGQLHTTNFIFS
jgi:hypothetical protein